MTVKGEHTVSPNNDVPVELDRSVESTKIVDVDLKTPVASSSTSCHHELESVDDVGDHAMTSGPVRKCGDGPKVSCHIKFRCAPSVRGGVVSHCKLTSDETGAPDESPPVHHEDADPSRCVNNPGHRNAHRFMVCRCYTRGVIIGVACHNLPKST